MTLNHVALRRAAVQARAARRATEMRDYWIREARAGGATFRAIAEAVGLTHTAAKKIVDKARVDALPKG